MFNLIEMKEPQVNLGGDLYSTFDAENNVNHYEVRLGWDMQFSDLNMKKPTAIKIWRHDNLNSEKVLVADIKVSVPELVDVTDVPGVEKAYAVSIDIVDGTAMPDEETKAQGNLYRGSFDFYDTTNKCWHLVAVTQKSRIRFDANSHRQLDGFKDYTNQPWVVFVERFDSPDLNHSTVPTIYTYTAEMAPYEYIEYVNNDNFELGTDKKRYHEVVRKSSEFVSPDYSVRRVEHPQSGVNYIRVSSNGVSKVNYAE